MPFTLVHPLAAIPFRKFKLPLSALIIGSMIPDFNYFILPEQKLGHTIMGQFYFCLPIGFFTFIVFHLFIKKSIIDLLPSSHSRALAQVKDINLRSIKLLFLAIIALLVGSFSHIIWDSFTHPEGYAVLKFPFLQMVIFNTPVQTLRLFNLLQYGCSAVGMVVLIIMYNRWRASMPCIYPYKSVMPRKFRYIIMPAILLLSFIIAIVHGYMVEYNIFYFNSFRLFTGTAIRTFFPALEFLLLSYGIIWTIYKRKVQEERS